MQHIPSIELNDHHSIPQLGFGTYQVDPGTTAKVVSQALSAGYRHLDTAQMYQNEAGVGEAVARSGLDRSEVFITTKLNNGFHEPAKVHESVADSLKKLGTDYIDLFIIHWPLPGLYGGDFGATWKAMEEVQAAGHARSIGVSNFQVPHLERLLESATVVPVVNQIEIHPYFRNQEVSDFGEANGIATEAWSPIAQGGVLRDAAITAIAEETGKTAAQVVLRWHIQHGFIVFPKSVSAERQHENFDLFSFELSEQQVERLDGLDKGEAGRTGPNPDEFNYVPA